MAVVYSVCTVDVYVMLCSLSARGRGRVGLLECWNGSTPGARAALINLLQRDGERAIEIEQREFYARRRFQYYLFFVYRSVFCSHVPPPTPNGYVCSQGEWLAFTSHAEEGGFWDVGASVASGANGTIVFRILVNATNCSSIDTDGFDGLGSEGVDLLDGPVYSDFTDSWEAFYLAAREDIWVPEGTHRVFFCSDSALFNLNYLRFYTPMPTPAPTPVPSPAPTNAPTLPDDDGVDTKWIYISVSHPSVFFLWHPTHPSGPINSRPMVS